MLQTDWSLTYLVLIESCTTSKCHLTLITLIGFLPCVYSFMYNQSNARLESSGTHAACEGFLTCVGPQMILECILLA
jgi:hypothetical protein